MDLLQALLIVTLGYSGLDASAKETWTMLRLFDDMPLTSGNLPRFAEIRGRHAETIRRQLKALRKAGLVAKRRDGDLILYVAADPNPSDPDFQDVQRALSAFSKHSANDMNVDPKAAPPLSFRREGEGPRSAETTSMLMGRQIVKWTSHEFLKYASDLYRRAYGHVSLDLEQSLHGERRQGVVVARIKKSLVKRFLRLGLKNEDVVKYLDWLFEEKAEALDINLGVICSRALQSEWMSVRQRNLKALAGKSDVTGRKQFECPHAKAAGALDAEAWRFYDPDDDSCKICIRRMRCSERA